jgi:hypothetical protein
MSDGSRAGTPMPQPQRPPAGPQAAAYGAGVAARSGGPPKYTGIRAGGPTPPIPRLDGPPGEGQTMSEMATNQRQPPSSVQGSIFGSQPQQRGPDIRPTDLLPPECQSDPNFIQGSGSMYAAAQPMLALKYGVIREGKRVPAQALTARPQTSGGASKVQLRPETIQGLEDLQKLRDQSLKGESGEMAAEKATEDSIAGRAASIGNPPTAGGDGPPPNDVEIKKRIAGMDEFDLNSLHEMMVRDIINNDEQRKIVEERLQPLDLSDLVVNFTVSQKVPIIPGIFEPEFESLTGEDDLEIKKWLVEEAKTLKVDDRYLLDKYSLMGLACAVKSINGKPLGNHRDNDGAFSRDLADKKFRKLCRMPLPMLAALGPHFFWFDMRVRKLFVAEKIKNG